MQTATRNLRRCAQHAAACTAVPDAARAALTRRRAAEYPDSSGLAPPLQTIGRQRVNANP